jgi:ATP-dependent helicase HrpA
MAVDGVACKLKYRFEPGHALDGVTLQLPLYLLNRIEPAQVDWLVPGLIREKLTLLLKSLPKDKRRPLIPLPDTVTAFLSVAKPGEQTLTEALAAFIRKKTGTDIHPDEWKGELPAHLQMNLSVIDDSGQELASGRDLVALRAQLGGAARITYGGGAEDSEFERTGLVEWNFGDLPEQVKFKRGGRELIGYPALVDNGETVDLRLLDATDVAEAETRRGVVRLLRIALTMQFKQLDKDLSRETALALKFRNFGSAEQLRAALIDAIATRALLGDDDTPRDAKTFGKQKERAKPRIAVVKQALLRDVAEILDLHAQVAARLPCQAAVHRRDARRNHAPGRAGASGLHHRHAVDASEGSAALFKRHPQAAGKTARVRTARFARHGRRADAAEQVPGAARPGEGRGARGAG